MGRRSRRQTGGTRIGGRRTDENLQDGTRGETPSLDDTKRPLSLRFSRCFCVWPELADNTVIHRTRCSCCTWLDQHVEELSTSRHILGPATNEFSCQQIDAISSRSPSFVIRAQPLRRHSTRAENCVTVTR